MLIMVSNLYVLSKEEVQKGIHQKSWMHIIATYVNYDTEQEQ